MIYFKNVRLLDDKGNLYPSEVIVDQGKVQAIGVDLSELVHDDSQIIDGQNALMAPGLVDVHVHFRQPGGEYKETVETGSKAAAHGGFTTVCAMPNLNPVPDNVDTFNDIQAVNKTDGVINVEQYATITKNLNSEVELVDYQGLADAGAFAFTNDGVGVQTAGTMYKAMKGIAPTGKALVAHTEDNSLLFDGVMHAGRRAKELGLPGLLSLTESTQVARDVLIAEETGCHYHVCHVSTKETIRVIREAKAAGIKVTCEVAPHHLILNEDHIPSDDANFKMNPPLRAKEDQEALIEGLLDGTIDCIATDHAPHSHEEKDHGMVGAPFGIVGSEYAFQLVYTHFVKKGIFTLKQVIEWMSLRPAEIFDLEAGVLYPGGPADLALFDIDNEYTIDPADFLSKSANTPFTGERLFGETIATLSQGKIAYLKD